MLRKESEDYELKKLASKLLLESSEDEKAYFRAIARELGEEKECEELLRGID